MPTIPIDNNAIPIAVNDIPKIILFVLIIIVFNYYY